MITITKCQICNNSEFNAYLSTKDFFFSEEEFTIQRCNVCGFVFTNPIPDKSKIGEYYKTDKYLSHDTANNGMMGKLYEIIRKWNLNNKLGIIKQFKQEGKILDIGCGTGEFLNHMQINNFEAIGIEPEAKARNFATKNYNLTIKKESGLSEFEKNSFDIISMWHVLEHVYDINARLKKIDSLLKKDGVFINALPMIDSPDSLKFGKYWAGLDVPRHLHHFSSDTFELLAKNNGFKIIKKYPMKFDSFYVSLLSHQAKNNSLAPIGGLFDGLSSNLKADKNKNYSSMIFVLQKS